MRRKTFNVLFENKNGMEILCHEHCLWRSCMYFILSLGFYGGVVTNHFFKIQPLGVRLALVGGVLLVAAVALLLYGFLLHGILETVGATSGNPVSLICLLGYTSLPFLLLTPAAYYSTLIGYEGILLFGATLLFGSIWTLYLLIRALQVVYIIDFVRAMSVVFLSIIMMGIAFVLPWYILIRLVLMQIPG